MEKSSDRLDEGYRIAQETEEIGLEIMDNLQRDRETIQRMRGRVGVVSCTMYITCGFKSHPRQLIFLRKSDCLGCAVLLCLVVCLTLLASSLMYNMYTYTVCLYCVKVNIDDLCTSMVGKSGNKATKTVVSLATCT